MPSNRARSAEADAEALLQAYGMAARPGPIARVAREVVEEISDALRGPYRLKIRYGNGFRLVEPYGVLLGARRYLVARQTDKDDKLRHFRLDRIEDAKATGEYFVRDEGFSLEDHAARAFGSYHDDGQYGEVIWRFSPGAAERALSWEFHPGQSFRTLDDGSLEVQFRAGGWLEMAWHLYQWGDQVEVIAPDVLREIAHSARRGDFDAFP
jgi:predicted DNA-binding transcriptional regulator YafY